MKKPPYRSFDVTHNASYREYDDGRVSKSVIRRTDDPTQMYHDYEFFGTTRAEADAAYEAWLAERYEVVHRHASRRAKWGTKTEGWAA